MSGSAPLTFRPSPHGATFTKFAQRSSDDISVAIARLPDKSSAADPIPVLVLKGISDVLTPFLTHLFNRSLAIGCTTDSCKDSFVMPILKNLGLDEASASSYRSISYLLVMSKLLEHLVMHQLVTYLDAICLFPSTQSGFRKGYSTETAIICVLSDLLDAVDRGDTAMLVLLGLLRCTSPALSPSSISH